MYRGPLLDDRQREIQLTRDLTQAAMPLLHEPDQHGLRALEQIETKIDFHNDNQPATPYREALQHLKRRIEAVRRGEALPVVSVAPPAPVAARAAINQPAPDFLVTDLTSKQSARLKPLLGKPILMVFYSPTSKTAEETLRFAQQVMDSQPGDLQVLGLAVSGETPQVLQQRSDLKLTFPILSGQGLRLTYGVDATPKLMVLDAAGIVRGSLVGWGPETEDLVRRELKTWCRPARQIDSNR
jgi:peroxiredoxin